MPVPLGGRGPAPGGTAEDLVALLLECHARIRRFLDLARLAGARADLPAGEVVEACARVERYFTQALPLHVRDEEEGLLPRLRGREPEVDRALEAMRAEHEAHAAPLRALLTAAAALRQAPLDASARAALAAAAATLEPAFAAHLALEEAVLFPAVRRLLPAAAQAEAVAELRARRRVTGGR